MLEANEDTALIGMLPVRNNDLTLIVYNNNNQNIVKKCSYLFAGT